MNLLYIDTRNNQEIIVRLETENKKFEQKSLAVKNHAQTILPLIEDLFKKAGINISDLIEIKVETGPGSYTGLRVGIAIANALSFGSNTTVNGKPLGEIVLPEY